MFLCRVYPELEEAKTKRHLNPPWVHRYQRGQQHHGVQLVQQHQEHHAHQGNLCRPEGEKETHRLQPVLAADQRMRRMFCFWDTHSWSRWARGSTLTRSTLHRRRREKRGLSWRWPNIHDIVLYVLQKHAEIQNKDYDIYSFLWFLPAHQACQSHQ